MIPVAGVVGELSPAKLLKVDLEPSSEVQVGRDEWRAQLGVEDGAQKCSKPDEERGWVSSEAEYTGRGLGRMDPGRNKTRMQS